MSTDITIRRCRICDGLQPLERAVCEVCGGSLADAHLVTVEQTMALRVAAEALHTREASEPSSAPPSAPSSEPASAPPAVGAAVRWATIRTFLGCAAAFAGLLTGASLLTFRLQGASADRVLGAAFSGLWPALAVAAGIWWAALTLDRISAMKWSKESEISAVGWAHLISCFGIAVACIGGALRASNANYVSPATWTLAVGLFVLAAVVGSLARIGLRIVPPTFSLRAGGIASVLIGIAITAGVSGLGWLISETFIPGRDVPTPAIVAALTEAVPLKNCQAVDVASNSQLLLRDIIRAEVSCKGGSLHGRFIWLRSQALLDLYASQRTSELNAFNSASCEVGGDYFGNWQQDTSPTHTLGQLICVGNTSNNRLEWTDDRSDVYGILTSQGTMQHMYSWWSHHEVSPSLHA